MEKKSKEQVLSEITGVDYSSVVMLMEEISGFDVIKAMQKYADQETAELREELERVKKEYLMQDNYKQIAFKLQSDIDMQIWFEADKNIPFLKEMREKAVKGFDDGDIASIEYVLKMIDDWYKDIEMLIASAEDLYKSCDSAAVETVIGDYSVGLNKLCWFLRSSK